MSVPHTYEGLWRRKGIWRSDGSSDTATPVWWFQAAEFHIDLRIPTDRKAMTAAQRLLRRRPFRQSRRPPPPALWLGAR